MEKRIISRKYKHCNHHHEPTSEQAVIICNKQEIVADKKRIALLKALNECGLITRTHCYGHETGHSFVSILLKNTEITIKDVTENAGTRKFPKGLKELLITWKRID